MHVFVLVIAIGLLILAVTFMAWIITKIYYGLKIFHRRLIVLSIFGYGIYLATLAGASIQFVLPGIVGISGGAIAGASIGFATYLAMGDADALAGGVGIAIGVKAVTLIGASLGAVGAASGGDGFQTVSYPLENPLFWLFGLLLSIYVFFGVDKQMRIKNKPQ